RSGRVLSWTLLAGTRAAALAMADKYGEPATFERIATLAWTQAQVQLHHLGITPEEAHLFQRIASRILYADPRLRAPAALLASSTLGPRALWAHRISGDLPIVVVSIDEIEDREIVRQLLRAHEYWRMKGLAVDLGILNDKPPSYLQDIQAALEGLVRAGRPTLGATQEGSIVVVRTDLLSPADRDSLSAAARGMLSNRPGPLAARTGRAAPGPRPARAPTGARAWPRAAAPAAAPRIRQRPRRLRRGRPRVLDRARRGALDAGAVDQRDRERAPRLSGLGVGRRLHVGAQQPREPAHALVERSGHRPAG